MQLVLVLASSGIFRVLITGLKLFASTDIADELLSMLDYFLILFLTWFYRMGTFIPQWDVWKPEFYHALVKLWTKLFHAIAKCQEKRLKIKIEVSWVKWLISSNIECSCNPNYNYIYIWIVGKKRKGFWMFIIHNEMCIVSNTPFPHY